MSATTTCDDVERAGRGRGGLRVLAVIGLLVVASVALWKADVRSDTDLPLGGHDFIAYWTAFEVGTEGGDPYDADTLVESQRAINDRYSGGPQHFWNPPWALVVLAPVLALPFDLATSVWFVLQVAGAVAVVFLSWRLFRPRSGAIPLLVLGLGLLFVPFLEGLILGQLGVYVAVCTMGGLVALREDRDTVAGALLALTVVKPQTVLLPLLVVGVHVLATRRWAVVRAALAVACSMIALSWVAFSSVWEGWDPLGGSPTHWYSATATGWFRDWLPAGAAGAPTWPILVVPILLLCTAMPWALRHRGRVEWDHMPGLLALSVLFAPYAWVSDAMVVVPVHLLAIAATVDRRRSGAVLGVVALGIQLGALWMRGQSWSAQQHLVVVPLGLLALHVLVRRADGYSERSSTEPLVRL